MNAPSPTNVPAPAGGVDAGWDWTSNTMLFVYILAGIVIAAVVAFLILRRTVRTRLQSEKRIAADPDINEWLVVFSWSPKVLYLPTIVVTLLAGVVTLVRDYTGWFDWVPPTWVGGVWFCVFLLNLIVEEYEVNLKVTLIAALAIGFSLLMLHLIGQVGSFFRVFRHVRIQMSGWTYLLFVVVGLSTLVVSWYRGLFYYIALTPNYMNLQWGPTESGEQIKRDQYRTTVDTSDLMERMLGFGRIIVTFLDQRRPPITLLVWRIGQKAPKVETLSGTFSIDSDGRRVRASGVHAPAGVAQSPDAPSGGADA